MEVLRNYNADFFFLMSDRLLFTSSGNNVMHNQERFIINAENET